MNTHFKSFLQSGGNIDTMPIFTSFKDVNCLIEIHQKGGDNALSSGMDILLERNARTPLKAAKLISWHIGAVKLDLTGYGKYSESHAIVEVDGKQIKWPFTMIYVKKAAD